MKKNPVRQQSVAINASMLDDKPTGVGVYSFHLINNLSEVLKTSCSAKQFTVFTPETSHIINGIDIIKLPSILQSSQYGKLAALSRFVWNTFFYPLQLRRHDLYISPTTHGSFTLKNQIITIHDLISLHYNNISFHQRLYFRYLLPVLLKRAKLIIAVSENTRADIMRFFSVPAEKIRVVYNGYDNNRFFPTDKKPRLITGAYGCENYFLAVGPTYPHKNFELLIAAYETLDPVVRDRHPLLIAGGKPAYVNVLKQLVRTKKLEKNIIFAGYVSSALMPALYREAFALIFPSLYEGFGIPVLEAMGSGCPVISSNAASMPEVGGEAALYFDPQSILSLVRCMKLMIANDELRRNCIHKGLLQSQKFSWKKMAEEFRDIIESSFTAEKN